MKSHGSILTFHLAHEPTQEPTDCSSCDSYLLPSSLLSSIDDP